MNKKKTIITSSLFSGILISNIPIDSMASLIEDNQITEIEKNSTENKLSYNIQNPFNIRRDFERKISKSKNNIKVNRNITKGSVYELILNEGDFVPDLTGNTDGYEIIKVTTNGNKKLVRADYNNLRLSGIPKIDLSDAYSDDIPIEAFYNATYLTEISFPNGIRSIGQSAFSGCIELTGDLVIPNSVETIGFGAFSGCSGFNGNLTIGNSVKSIGDYAFLNCVGFVGDLVIPNSVESIGGYAFEGCARFNGDLTIGNSVASIGGYAFRSCKGFTGNLTIGNSVTYIGNQAFRGCSGLTGELIIPSSITVIGDDAFNGCSGFTGNLVIPNLVTTIGNNAFNGCSGFNGNLIISDSVISIGNYAFHGCSGFNGNLTIGSSVTNIGNNAFYGCVGLIGDLTIPNSVTTIGNGAFFECKGLTGDLVIPNSVTSVGDSAFRGCDGFNGALTIGNSLTSIGNNVFYKCSGLTGNLIIPDSVTTIGNNAFWFCSGFNGTLTIGNSVESIGYSTFYGCVGFTGDLIIPNSVTNIGDLAFNGCNGFTGNLNISNSVTLIGNSAFNGCNGFTGKLVIPDSVINIGSSAFQGCRRFTGELVIPNSVTTIGSSAFNNCNNLEKIVIKVDSLDLDNNYKENIIANLPDTSQTVIDLPYDFNIIGTWMETTNKTIGKPIIKEVINGAESNLVNLKGEAVSLYIPSLYKESSISILRENKSYALPSISNEGKYIFTELGIYQVTITTDLGNTSIIEFEVETPAVKEIEENLKEMEAIKDVEKVSDTRELINSLPESIRKNQLQEELNNIFPDIEFEKKMASANLDLYIKSENMLLISLNTNQITFDDFSGVSDMLKDDAVEVSINSSLPYNLNAYLMTEIQNSDKSNTMDKEIFQLKEDSEVNYQYFNNINEKMILKNNCEAGNDKVHLIDFNLKGGIAHQKDIYKTVVKFEAEQI